MSGPRTSSGGRSSTTAKELAHNVAALIGGQVSLEHARQLLAPDVLCHMGRLSARGIDHWTAWVAFIRSRGFENLEVVVDDIEEHAGGLVTAHGRFQLIRRGHQVRGGPARVTCRLEGDRIAEIWTHRDNYAVLFGWRARYWWSWLLVLLQMALWKRRRGRTTFSPSGDQPGRRNT